MLSIIFIYIFFIYLFYVIIFYKICFPVKQRNIIILLHNWELRWWGWFITHHILIDTFLWIPYKIKNIHFKSINKYYEESSWYFKEKLSKHISFRDSNYSIFQEENFQKMKYFQEKSLDYKVNNFIQINLSAVENIIPNIPVKYKNIVITKNNFFMKLSQLIWDTDLWKFNRKNILLHIGIQYFLYILIIPFYIFLILWKITKEIYYKNIFILNEKTKDIPKIPYIWLEENNLIGRKGNKFMSNKIEYNFLVDVVLKNSIYWKWMIKVHKSYFWSHSFPISWKYKALLNVRYSNHFILSNTQKYFELSDGESLYHEIPFTFTLPKKWWIKILKQIWQLNENIFINFETKIFNYLPDTNLNNKVYHYNYENFVFKRNYQLNYNILADNSELKFQYRKIIEPWHIVIWFNKKLLNLSHKNFELKYKDIWIDIIQIQKIGFNENEIHIYYKEHKIPKYEFKKEIFATLKCKNLQDIHGNIFYEQWRVFSLPWHIKK